MDGQLLHYSFYVNTKYITREGIDMALRILEHYDGRDIVQFIAKIMQYQSPGWIQEAASPE